MKNIFLGIFILIAIIFSSSCLIKSRLNYSHLPDSCFNVNFKIIDSSGQTINVPEFICMFDGSYHLKYEGISIYETFLKEKSIYRNIIRIYQKDNIPNKIAYVKWAIYQRRKHIDEDTVPLYSNIQPEIVKKLYPYHKGKIIYQKYDTLKLKIGSILKNYPIIKINLSEK